MVINFSGSPTSISDFVKEVVMNFHLGGGAISYMPTKLGGGGL